VEGLSWSENGGVNMAFMVQSDITLPVLDELGTREQKEEFLRPAIAGDYIAAPRNQRARRRFRRRCHENARAHRRRRPGHQRSETLDHNGCRADFIILGVRTGDEGHKGISFVLLPTKTKGFSVGKKLKKIGMNSSDTAELFFDECRIPKRYLLGEMNRGFYYIMQNFQGERLAAALGAQAGAERMLDYAMNYGNERTAFGSPIRKFQVWKHRFAEHLTNLEAGKWLTYRALDLMNRGQKCVREITMAKLYTPSCARKSHTTRCRCAADSATSPNIPSAASGKTCGLHTIGAGTSEIMKEILAKDYKI
jgi:citronellyl-CoA dehydrogenase